jgi:phospholipid transport system substrate-binding protein
MKFLACLLAFLSLSVAAVAQDLAPDTLIKGVTDDVLAIVRTDPEVKGGNARKISELVDAKVLPHFNFARMTQLALGREWRKATPAQQKTLTDEFRDLLVRTYSKALTEYRNQTIAYKPVTLKPNDTEAKVRTELRQGGAKPIELDYYLEKSPTGWKVFDIEIGGISLVMNYRETFGDEIRRSGIEGLIAELQAKNKSGAAVSGKK